MTLLFEKRYSFASFFFVGLNNYFPALQKLQHFCNMETKSVVKEATKQC